MIVTVLGLVRFGFSLLFGVGVTVLFAGIAPTRNNKLVFGLVTALLLAVQTASWYFSDWT